MALNEKWESLSPSINENIIKAIHSSFGYKTMMPVQKASIPLFLTHHDVAVEVSLLFKTISYLKKRLQLALEKL